MFSDEILEKFYARNDVRSIDLVSQVVCLRAIEEVIEEVSKESEVDNATIHQS